jgi:hypothetical protein
MPLPTNTQAPSLVLYTCIFFYPLYLQLSAA